MTGGGVAYIRAQAALADVKGDNVDEQTGIATFVVPSKNPCVRSAATQVWKAR